MTTIGALPHIALPGDISWVPIRAELGVRAHGVNAWIAHKAGADVIEEHTESEAAQHQELYFVVSGHARFLLDGVPHDAPAGSIVFVPDWRTTRQAIAEVDDTVVLSCGGPAEFEPSPWEWSQRALLLADDHPDEARRILKDGIRELPDNGAMHYNFACLEAKLGQLDAAAGRLARAIELRPDLARNAADDSDLASLHGTAAFDEIVGPR